MARFDNLKDKQPASPPTIVPRDDPAASPTRRPPSRQGKRAVVGHFSPELSRALNVLAATEDTTVQALLGEAIDLLMRDRGKHPFRER